MPQHADYIQSGDLPFSAQLNTFATVIPGYAAGLNVDPATVTAQAGDAAYFAYVLQCADILRKSAQQWTAWKNLLRNGGAAPVAGVPQAPVLPKSVAPVAPGVEGRFRDLCGQVKSATSYTTATGEALDIEGAEQVGPNLATVQPIIEAHISGNRVEIKWGWQGMSAFLDLCELQVDRTGTGTFAPLAFDTTPGYVDTQPFPAAPVKWTYRAIYRKGDNQVGVWSKTVSVTVGG